MEQTNYYVRNEETGKLNIFTDKTFYDSLASEQKNVFQKFCLWSRKQECWISKGKAQNCVYLKARLDDLGFLNKGSTGERLSFEEQVTRQQEKAAQRAERLEGRAEKADKNSKALYDTAKDMASIIPFGQPILVGHHSEKRDRNYRDRIHNKFGKAFEEMDKAEYYRDKADLAKYTAEGKQFSNPKYLANRIRECEKNLRILERRLKGKFNARSPESPISDTARAFYVGRIKEEQEKLDYYNKCMKAINPDYSGKIKTTDRKNRNKPGM